VTRAANVASAAIVIAVAIAGYVTAPRYVDTPRSVATEGPRVEPTSVARTPSRTLSVPAVAGPRVRRGMAPHELRTALIAGDSYAGMFEREERDERWAAAVEGHLRESVTQYQRTMLPFANSVRLECRATACQVEVVVPKQKFQETSSLLQGLPLGESIEPLSEDISDSPDLVRLAITTVYADGNLDDAQIKRRFDAELARRFPTGLAATRAFLDNHPEALAGRPANAPPDGGTQ